MKKTLKDLTAEDWGRLFPIELEPYNQNWPKIYNKEQEQILSVLDDVMRLEHFGSSSIPEIISKPIIDIIIEIPSQEMFSQKIITALESLDYTYFEQKGNDNNYMVFVKGYNLEGKKEQKCHIHMCTGDHDMWQQIHFRDYLRKNPETARAYGELKKELSIKFKNDRVGYRIAKTDFIKSVLELALS